ncbi:uncharacterized protein LOC133203122 [Saccostrea echinata]|uniref:uncharacterized protein LOC133203122 n=1 Tax=Saccostrea echinata TaxID=191078 RepID=UPI002A83E0FA|nr:uncharacterized protein LOC133203122 [Saccostrea echinata]
MDWKIFTLSIAQSLGLSTVFGYCNYNPLTKSFDDCTSYDDYNFYGSYKYYNYYSSFSNTLSAGLIVGIVFGALTGLATLIGFIAFLYHILCRKPTQNQGALMLIPNTSAGTAVVQATQSSMQPYHQQGLCPANTGQMQTNGQGVAASFASPPKYSPPQQSTKNQDL